jgi:hypothetical protein
MKIPEGYVEVEIEIDENDGSYKRKIVGHGPKTSCKLERDDELMDDLFEGLGSVDDNDHTDEYYSEKEVLIQNPIASNTNGKISNSGSQNSNKEKRTLGFDV